MLMVAKRHSWRSFLPGAGLLLRRHSHLVGSPRKTLFSIQVVKVNGKDPKGDRVDSVVGRLDPEPLNTVSNSKPC